MEYLNTFLILFDTNFDEDSATDGYTENNCFSHKEEILHTKYYFKNISNAYRGSNT